MLHVTAMTMRRDAIYPSIVVGPPPAEDVWLGKATERIFLPAIRATLPEIVDYDLPFAGAFHNCCIVSIRKAFPGHARKVMHAIWGLGLLSLTKCVIVVDADVDVHDYDQVTWQVGANVDPGARRVLSSGPLDQLDHAPAIQSLGGKIGIDATAKWAVRGVPARVARDRAHDATTCGRRVDRALGRARASRSTRARARGGSSAPSPAARTVAPVAVSVPRQRSTGARSSCSAPRATWDACSCPRSGPRAPACGPRRAAGGADRGAPRRAHARRRPATRYALATAVLGADVVCDLWPAPLGAAAMVDATCRGRARRARPLPDRRATADTAARGSSSCGRRS